MQQLSGFGLHVIWTQPILQSWQNSISPTNCGKPRITFSLVWYVSMPSPSEIRLSVFIMSLKVWCRLLVIRSYHTVRSRRVTRSWEGTDHMFVTVYHHAISMSDQITTCGDPSWVSDAIRSYLTVRSSLAIKSQESKDFMFVTVYHDAITLSDQITTCCDLSWVSDAGYLWSDLISQSDPASQSDHWKAKIVCSLTWYNLPIRLPIDYVYYLLWWSWVFCTAWSL